MVNEIFIAIMLSLTIISILIIITAHKKDNDGWKFAGWTILIIEAIFGWGVIGCVVPMQKLEISISPAPEVTKSKNHVIVYDGKYSPWVLDDAKSYNCIDGNTDFFWIESYNAYGGRVHVGFGYVCKSDKKPKENL